MTRRFCLIAVLIMVMNTTDAQQPDTQLNDGKVIFDNKCSRCHGSDGAKGKFGAADLRHTTLNAGQLSAVISNGRRLMPRWNKSLNREQILAVTAYVRTLHH